MAFTKLYLTTDTAPYTPATIRGAWDVTAGSVTRLLSTGKEYGGTITQIQVNESNAAANYDVLLYRGVTGPLAAQTIAGTVDVVLGVAENLAAADLAFHLHIYVTQGDSDTVRGTLLANYVETTANEWPVTPAVGRALAAAQTLTNIGAITAGDRIVVEIGYVALNASATLYGGALTYGTQRAGDGAAVADLAVAGTDVTLKAGFIEFNTSVTEPDNASRTTSSPALVTTSGTGAARTTASPVLVTSTPGAAQARTTSSPVLVTTAPPATARTTSSPVLVTVRYVEPIEGGGPTASGPNPAAAPSPGDAPLKFLELHVNGVEYAMAADSHMNDAIGWYHGQKLPHILTIGAITRQLSQNGAPEAVEAVVTFADPDHFFRDLGTTTSIRGAYCAIYVVSRSVELAEGVPLRLFAGKVKKHRPLPDRRYEITVVDILSYRVAEVWTKPKFPNKILTTTEFPALEPGLNNLATPMILGRASDEAEADPQGVARGRFAGTFNLSVIGGVSVVVDAILFAGHAPRYFQNLYVNPPAWTASEVVYLGDIVRPNAHNGHIYTATTAGTSGATAPAFPTGAGATVSDGGVVWTESGAYDEGDRLLVPEAAYGTVLVAPDKPGWAAATGLATRYVPYNGYYYTMIFIDHAHRYAAKVRKGEMQLFANIIGMSEFSDGTGLYIDSPDRAVVHLITNFLENEWGSGAWNAMPTMNGYAIVDSTTVETAKDVGEALLVTPDGYVIGGVIAQDGTQVNAVDVIGEILKQTNGQSGINRHGQFMLARRDTTALPVRSYTEQLDILEGGFDVDLDADLYFNRLYYLYGHRGDLSTYGVGVQGSPLPEARDRQQWASGLLKVEDVPAQAHGLKSERLEMTWVRDTNTATSVAAQLLSWRLGPTAPGDGRRVVKIPGGWELLTKDDVTVELNDAIEAAHDDGTSVTGGMVKMRVIAITVEPLDDRVTLTCEIFGGTAGTGEP